MPRAQASPQPGDTGLWSGGSQSPMARHRSQLEDRSSKKKRHPSEAEPGRRITNGGGGVREVLYVLIQGINDRNRDRESQQRER